MTRITVGEELRALFSAHQEGAISTSDFERRKKALLDWSKCHLLRRLPLKMRR
jgi:hypothetical protein